MSELKHRDDYKIQWIAPPTADGWMGKLEDFLGPGKTRSESIIEVLALFYISILLYFNFHTEVTNASLPFWKKTVLILLVLDLVGGIITNSTNSAKRRYHFSPSSKGRLFFIGAHHLHLLVVSFVFLNFDWKFFIVNSILLMSGTMVLEKVSFHTKRPLAMFLFLITVGLQNLIFLLPDFLILFPSLFYLKLFVCFLVSEVPAYGIQSR